MAWEWTDVNRIKGRLFSVTATESVSGDVKSFRVVKGETSPANIVAMLQSLVDRDAAIEANKVVLMNQLVNNVDISGVS